MCSSTLQGIVGSVLHPLELLEPSSRQREQPLVLRKIYRQVGGKERAPEQTVLRI